MSESAPRHTASQILRDCLAFFSFFAPEGAGVSSWGPSLKSIEHHRTRSLSPWKRREYTAAKIRFPEKCVLLRHTKITEASWYTLAGRQPAVNASPSSSPRGSVGSKLGARRRGLTVSLNCPRGGFGSPAHIPPTVFCISLKKGSFRQRKTNPSGRGNAYQSKRLYPPS